MNVLLPALAVLQGATFWCPKGVADDPDSDAAFRATFTSRSGPCEIRLLGASEFLVWLDGKLLGEGPARFPQSFPEYQTFTEVLVQGPHVLAVHARNDGVTTRILSAIRPFLWCEMVQSGVPLNASWKCSGFEGYRPRTHRISDILGWIDWLDTGMFPSNWNQPKFDDSGWEAPVESDPRIGPIARARTKPTTLTPIRPRLIAQGRLTEEYGYDADDPAARFFLRDLHPEDLPPQGVWRRYDLGRVRLGRPCFTLDLAKGSVVEFALCEQLRHGRGHAWITLSGSPSCNLDHFVSRGGKQEFMPLTAKGGRFLEVHVLSGLPVQFLVERFLETTYFGDTVGSFECDDPNLNRVWKTGVETVRACAEDALVDCPTRERGEWTGDVASVATDICSVAYADLSLCRRALVQAAQAARGDGLVAGVGPGDPSYLSTYAAQWVSACVHYWELSGDRSLLDDLFPAAVKNLQAFRSSVTSEGVSDKLGWAFVDWGYVRNDGPTDMALNVHYYMALRSMARWCLACGREPQAAGYQREAEQMKACIQTWLNLQLSKPGGWKNVGYHRAALALLADLVDPGRSRLCIGFIEHHLMSCFPNDANAPRLSDPSVSNDLVMTPYFCHFSFLALLRAGETDFVLGQYRRCWGWALQKDRTTWLEVFDPRWSHCHEWSGCPTWQLSRFVLGFTPRFDLGKGVYDVNIQTGGLKHVSGVVPVPGGKPFRASWTKMGGEVKLTVDSQTPLTLRIRDHAFFVAGHFEKMVPLK